jgi:hypothetical protein
VTRLAKLHRQPLNQVSAGTGVENPMLGGSCGWCCGRAFSGALSTSCVPRSPLQPFDACARYFQTALEEEQEQDGTISVGSLCAAWDKVKNDTITMCVHPHRISVPILRIKCTLIHSYDYVSPCFPPEWDFFNYWCKLVHRQYENQVSRLQANVPPVLQL